MHDLLDWEDGLNIPEERQVDSDVFDDLDSIQSKAILIKDIIETVQELWAEDIPISAPLQKLIGENLEELSDTFDENSDKFEKSFLEELTDLSDFLGDLFKDALEWEPPVYKDPLILDLNGDGVTVTADQVYFDLNADGIKHLTTQWSAVDGFLFLDINDNGKVDSGAELFGDATEVLDGSAISFNDGYHALRYYDENNDTTIDSNDSIYSELKIWVDNNVDGISQENEIFTLQELNVATISVSTLANSLNSSYTDTDGVEHETESVIIRDSGFYREFSESITVPDYIASLPNIKGSGTVRDLDEAASQSSALAGALAAFGSISNRSLRIEQANLIVDEWARVSVDFDGNLPSTSGEVSKLQVVWRFAGEPIPSFTASGANSVLSPNPHFERSYEFIRKKTYLELSAQTTLKEYLDKIDFSLSPDGLVIDISGIVTSLDDETNSKELVSKAMDIKSILGKLSNSETLPLASFIAESFFSLSENEQLELSEIIQFNNIIWNDDPSHTQLQLNTKEGFITVTEALVVSSYDGTNNDIILGGEGTDYIDGGDGDDVLRGGGGNNDFLTGKKGNDTFLFGLGDGDTTIRNNDSLSESVDILRFDEGVNASDITVSRSNTNLLMTIGSTGEVITLQYFFGYALEEIDKVEFSDGTVWTTDDLKSYSLGATDSSDSLDGFATDDVINGMGGSDTIRGYDGDDTLNGGADNDYLFGYDGNDTLNGGADNDTLYGGRGEDTLSGGLGTDNLKGDSGNDYLYGNEGNDILDGGSGTDYLDGGSGNDYLDGGDGDDTLRGGGGTNDTLTGWKGSDTYLFGLGEGDTTIRNNDSLSNSVDVLRFDDGISASDITVSRNNTNLLMTIGSTGEVITLKYFFGSSREEIDKVEFSDGTVWTTDDLKSYSLGATDSSDSLDGFATDDVINGMGGSDTIRGYDGDDTLNGGADNDYLFGYDGNDTLNGGADNDTLYGGRGEDTLSGGLGTDNLKGDSGNDYLYGNEGNDILDGGSGTDYLDGGSGNDYLDGGDGDDTLRGGGGTNDTLTGWKGSDTYLFGLGEGDTTIRNNDSLSNSVDVLRFDDGISASDITVSRNNTNLLMTIGSTGEVITLKYFFGSSREEIDKVEFSDGTIWTTDDLKSYSLGASPLLNSNILNSQLEKLVSSMASYDAESSEIASDTTFQSLPIWKEIE